MRTFSVGGTNGAATRTAATIRPAAIDVATIAPILLLAVRFGSGWRSLYWVRVIVTASPRASDLQSQARTACASTKRHVHVEPSVGAPRTGCAGALKYRLSRSISGSVALLADWSHRPPRCPHPTPAVVKASAKPRLGPPRPDDSASRQRALARLE